jgi:glycogen operon protein
MITMGDEMGRTQRGNNNAYCQDNEISWVDWDLDAEKRALLQFTRHLLAIRREHPVFRRRNFFSGERVAGVKDIGWIRPDGAEMTAEDWTNPVRAAIGMAIHGERTGLVDDAGVPIRDESFLLLLNASNRALSWKTPDGAWGLEWEIVIDTAESPELSSRALARVRAGETVEVAPHTFTLLVRSR